MGYIKGRIRGIFGNNIEISDVNPLIAALIAVVEYDIYKEKHRSNGSASN